MINSELLLKAEKLVHGGFALCRHDNNVILVPRLLPGEVARVKISKKRAGIFHGKILEIVERSEKRIEPTCKHYEHCGGCSLQHIDYQTQLKEKSSIFTETIEKIGHLKIDSIYDALHPSPLQWGYRNKMEFSFGKDKTNRVALCLHERERYDSLVHVNDCKIAMPEIVKLGEKLVVHVNEAVSFVHDTVNFVERLRCATFRGSFHSRELLLGIGVEVHETDSVHVHDFFYSLFERLKSDAADFVSGWVSLSSSFSFAGSGGVRHVFGSSHIVERFGGVLVRVNPLSFIQVNTMCAEKLYDCAREFLGLTGCERVLDLYSGVGVIGFYLAPFCREVVCVELVEAAVEEGRANAVVNGAQNVRFVAGDVRVELRRIIESDKRYDCVVLDPPRAGVSRRVIERVKLLAPERILYISCNPATMARDLFLFMPNYRLARLTAFDMFPQTYHIEGMALLERTNA